MGAMSLGQALEAFAADDKVSLVLTLIVVDVILGVIASVWMKTFTVSYVGDFLRRDVLFKVVPWFTLYFAGKVSDANAVPGLDFSVLADGVFGLVTAALAGSILSSLYQLKLTSDEGKELASGKSVGGKVLTTLFGPENPRAAQDG